MLEILSEITPITEKDCFHIVERQKSYFDYPLHHHKEYELNFVQHARGVRRIVGDSVEEIGDFDLVLITGEDVEHVWEQGRCQATDIREITVQFGQDLLPESLLARNQFRSIHEMFEAARSGISFPIDAIMRVYPTLDKLASENGRFTQFLDMLSILYELSNCERKILASSTFSHVHKTTENDRVQRVKEYINDHYTEDLSLEVLASVAGMGTSSFSRFFRQRTGKTLSSYILDYRLGIAARALVDTSRNISEICYGCGFNNLSNFNRIFKQKRGMTPKEFRSIYRKMKVLV